MNKEKQVNCISLNTTAKQFYDIDNERCPVCKKEFTTLTNLFVQYRVGVHLQCHINAQGQL